MKMSGTTFSKNKPLFYHPLHSNRKNLNPRFFLGHSQKLNRFQNRFTWEVKLTHTSLRFQTSGKTSSVLMKSHLGCLSKRPNIVMEISRHFISDNVYFIFYHPKWNFIFFKMSDMKSIAPQSFKYTCILNQTSNQSPLIPFVSGKLCWHENLMPIWNFISVKMSDLNSVLKFILPQFMWTQAKSWEHQREISNWNEISY